MAESDLIRGNVDTVILKVLFEGDRYGYDLIKQINARSDGQWEIKQPTVYACLKRLEKQDFISSYWDSSDSDGGRRKYYSLTESGKQVFLKYKSEFERANALFGGLISGDEPQIYVQQDDDYSDVEDEGYSVPKRPRPRHSKPQQPQQQHTTDKTYEQPEQQAQQAHVQTDDGDKKFEQDDLFAILSQLQAQSPVAQTEPKDIKPVAETATAQTEQCETTVRETLDPHAIIQKFYAAERGESYADARRKSAFSELPAISEKTSALQQTAPPLAPTEYVKPISEVATQPEQNAAQTSAETTAPITQSAPQQKQLAPQTQNAQATNSGAVGIFDDESLARREYKTVLGELAERYGVSSPDVRTARAIPAAEQAAATEAALTMSADEKRLINVEQAVRELGDDVRVRSHNDSAKEYTNKYYYYGGRLMMTHYTIMCAAMFATALVLFLAFYAGIGLRMRYDFILYIAAGLLPIAMFIGAVIVFAENSEKTKRINVNFGFSFAIRCIIMIQVAVVIYCLNLIWGMPVAFSPRYIPSLVIPCAYALFIPISELIYMILLKSGRYAACRD